MTRIRKWFRQTAETRRTYIEIEEKAQKRDQRQIAVDVRHGILPLAGRSVA